MNVRVIKSLFNVAIIFTWHQVYFLEAVTWLRISLELKIQLSFFWSTSIDKRLFHTSMWECQTVHEVSHFYDQHWIRRLSGFSSCRHYPMADRMNLSKYQCLWDIDLIHYITHSWLWPRGYEVTLKNVYEKVYCKWEDYIVLHYITIQ